MVKARKYVVKNRFEGLPKRDDYEVVEFDLPALGDGDFAVKAEWISVDPYMRGYNGHTPVPYDQFGFQIGTVIESKNPEFPVGCKVVSHKGWFDYYVMPRDGLKDEKYKVYKLPDMKGLPVELALGAVGMTGITAYLGLLEVLKPESGQTIVVSGAAGAVGSLVGQIAKIKGCKVIGFAGSDQKVKWLENLGFDKGINYKKADIAKVLKDAAPDGVDGYFDNVGGEVTSVVFSQMKRFGRVAVCGCISQYNTDPTKRNDGSLLPSIILKQLKVEGFHVSQWYYPENKWPTAIGALIEMVKTGKVIARSHITEGFDNIFDAFVGLLNGENCGKAVVKV